MQVKPVRQYSDPSFPTRSILDERPELLRLVPRRWQANPAVLTALTGVFALTLGARAIAQNVKTPPINKVAPIFVHGDGAGAFGCMAINPPVFLSEDEARAVILDEAKRSDINFKPDSLVLENIGVPITDRNGFQRYDKDGKPIPFKPAYHWQTFRFDGTDAKRSISFEYVSDEDFESWEKRPQTMFSTAEDHELKPTAEYLKPSFENRIGAGTVAIFYDPCIGPRDLEKRSSFKIDYKAKDMKAEYAKMREKADQLSREDLRAQVQDFIKWLKAEGVI